MQLFKKGTSTKIERDRKNSVTLLLAAAGSGTRLGGVSKPLLPLDGRPAVCYSLDAFSAVEDVTRIVISTKKDDIPAFRDIVKQGGYTKVVAIVEGGSTRQESVKKAFDAAFGKKRTDFVAIHDAARPLITQGDIEAALLDARTYGAAVCASRIADTVKRTDRVALVTESVDRENLYALQTPQVFSCDIYAAALAAAERDGFEATDDSSLVQKAGFRIKLTDACRENFKITYPDDVALAELVLKSRAAKKASPASL